MEIQTQDGVSYMIDTDDLDNMSRRDLVELLEAYNESLAEVKRLREDIEGYKAIWDYLDPKGYAWEEEAFVALLKEHGFETGEEE